MWVDGRQEVLIGPNGVVGEAFGANTDGSIIVGGNCSAGEQAAWMWRRESGITCYPPPRLRLGGFNVLMQATSEDGRIVAETIIGLLQMDEFSYLNSGFTPTLPSQTRGTFRMTDLLRWARVDPFTRNEPQ